MSARHRLVHRCATHWAAFRTEAEVVEAVDPRGVAGRYRDLHDVSGEDLGLAFDLVGVDQLVHVGRVGRGEHVGGAPARICSRRAEEAPKFSSTVVPGFSSSKVSAISPKASVSEAAASTVIEPVGPSVFIIGIDPHISCGICSAGSRR